MPSRAVPITFTFGAASQDRGARHLPIGALTKARNVRQVKAGRLQKRRGFTYETVAETFVIGDDILTKAGSVLAQNNMTSSNVTGSVPISTEAVLSAVNDNNGLLMYDWPKIITPGSSITIGIAGVFTVTGNTLRLRLRIGGAPAGSSTTPAGDSIIVSDITVGAGQVIDLSAGAISPAVLSYLEATVEGIGGTSTFDINSLQLYVVIGGATQALCCTTTNDQTISGGETVRNQWLVDFDYFDSSLTNLVCNYSGRTLTGVSGTIQVRTRLGGTKDVADGTILTSYQRFNEPVGDGTLTSLSATIVRPTGVQLVKATTEHISGATGIHVRGNNITFKSP